MHYFQRRVNQEVLLRFSEAGWQVWNLWAKKIFESCCSIETFHPLGVITDEEWQREEERINDVQDERNQDAQLAHLAEVRELRDEALARYLAGGHNTGKAFLQAVPLIKGIGVSSLTAETFSFICVNSLLTGKCLLQGFYAVALKASRISPQPGGWAQFKGSQDQGCGGLYDFRWHPKVFSRAVEAVPNQAKVDYFVRLCGELQQCVVNGKCRCTFLTMLCSADVCFTKQCVQ